MKGLLIFLCLLSPVYYTGYTSYVYWDERRMLTWDDFKCLPGSIVYPEGFAAETECGFVYRRSEIHAVMYKEKSWSLKAQQSDYGLNHEQGHFDIAEINARKLRKAILGRKFDIAVSSLQVDSLFNNYFDSMYVEQDLYDLETEHSIREGAQRDWDKRIQNELKEYDGYSNPKIQIRKY